MIVFSPPYAHLHHSRLPFAGPYRCDRPRHEPARRRAPAPRLRLRSPPPARRLSRSATRSGRVGRCGPRTRPCVRAGLILARSRLARQFSGCLCHRCRGPATHRCSRGRPAQARSQELSAARAHALALDRLAARGSGAWRGCFSSAAGALSAHAWTARVAECWKDVGKAVCSRLGVVLGRAVGRWT
jgi:hypothetical protein